MPSKCKERELMEAHPEKTKSSSAGSPTPMDEDVSKLKTMIPGETDN